MKMSRNKIIALIQSSPQADILRPLCILDHVVVAEAPRDRYTTPLWRMGEPRPRSRSEYTAESRLKLRPRVCIPLSSFQDKAGEAGLKPKRIIRGRDGKSGVNMAAWEESSRELREASAGPLFHLECRSKFNKSDEQCPVTSNLHSQWLSWEIKRLILYFPPIPCPCHFSRLFSSSQGSVLQWPESNQSSHRESFQTDVSIIGRENSFKIREIFVKFKIIYL